MTAPGRAADEAAVKRVTAFLRAVESYDDDEEGNVIASECNRDGGPDDPGYLVLTRNDLRAVVDRLERLGRVEQERDAAEEANYADLCDIEAAFQNGWNQCRDFIAEQAERRRGEFFTAFSNELPWPGSPNEGGQLPWGRADLAARDERECDRG